MLYWLQTDWLTEWLADWLYGTESVVPHTVKKFPCFMASECSSPSPQQAAICPHPELDEFTPCRKILLFTRKMLYSILLPSRSMLHKWLFFFSQEFAPKQLIIWKFSCSQWPRTLRRGLAAIHLMVLRVQIPPCAWMSVSCEGCVFSGRGIGDGLVTRPEESYTVWCVSMRRYLEASTVRKPRATRAVDPSESFLAALFSNPNL